MSLLWLLQDFTSPNFSREDDSREDLKTQQVLIGCNSNSAVCAIRTSLYMQLMHLARNHSSYELILHWPTVCSIKHSASPLLLILILLSPY